MDSTGFSMTFYGKGFSKDYEGEIKYVYCIVAEHISN
jgi:hypothetical protein